MNAGTSTSQVSPCGFNGPIVAAIAGFYKKKIEQLRRRLCASWRDLIGSADPTVGLGV